MPSGNADDADDHHRPDVAPNGTDARTVEDRRAGSPRSAYVAGEIFDSHCIHSGSTDTG